MNANHRHHSREAHARPAPLRRYFAGFELANALEQLAELRLLFRRESLQRTADFADREATQLAAVLHVLNVLAALLEEVEERHEFLHEPLSRDEILPDDTCLVQRDMRRGHEVRGASDPALRTPQ